MENLSRFIMPGKTAEVIAAENADKVIKLQAAIDSFAARLDDGSFAKLLKKFPVEASIPEIKDIVYRSRWVFVMESQVRDAVEYLKAHITILQYESKYRSNL